MERRIFGLENEYGVTCTLRGQRRLSPDEVARYLFRRVVSAGAAAPTCSCRTAPACTSTSARTPSTPRPSATRSTTSSSTTRRASGSSRALVESAEQRLARGGDPRHDLPVQEQHRLGRQQLRLPRELPHQPRATTSAHYAEVLIPFLVSRQIYTGAGKVLQTARGAMYSIAQRAEHIWEGVSLGHHPQPADHQHPRRAARRRRALPAPARHRRRLQHERVHDVRQGRRRGVHAADARGPAASCCAT